MASIPDPEQTFVQLMVSHQSALRAFVISMLPGSDQSDDIIQETNAELWKKRGEFKIGTNFKAWMFSVAKFKIMSFWRDQSRRKEWVVPEETLFQLIERVEEDDVFGATEEKHEALRLCLKKLKAVDRLLILRRYMDGQSLIELADQVGRTPDSLKVSFHRIRLMLRNCVAKKLAGSGGTAQ
jgi:RNA polymerase sigma-70 factor (ECF subfamily)